MNAVPRIATGLIIVALLVTTAWAQLRTRGEEEGESPESRSASARYQVTDFPAHREGAGTYNRVFEQYLNTMASTGWRYHSTVTGPTHHPMLIFERATGR